MYMCLSKYKRYLLANTIIKFKCVTVLKFSKIQFCQDILSKIYLPICWSIYKFHQKIVQFKIIENSYELNVCKYDVITNLETLPQNYYITFVCNKLGEESVGFNMQIKKHKTTKISIITDDFNIYIYIYIYQLI